MQNRVQVQRTLINSSNPEIRAFSGATGKSKLSKMAYSHQKANNQPKSSSQDELIPWILHPIDMPTPVRENCHRQPSVPPPPMPERQTLPISIPIELTDTSYIVLKSALAKINQDKNNTFSAKGPSSRQPQSASSIPEPTSAMEPPSLVHNTAQKQTDESSKNSQNGSKIGVKDETMKLIELVYNYPLLYDTEDPSYRDKEKKQISWTIISKILRMTEYECRTRWKALREKYSRDMKQLTVSGQISDKTKQFLDNMNFLPYQKRSATKRKNTTPESQTSPMSPTMNRKKSKSASHSPVEETPPDTLSSSHSHTHDQSRIHEDPRIMKNSSRPDHLFADDIATELQRHSPWRRNLLKAKIWQVLVEFGDPI